MNYLKFLCLLLISGLSISTLSALNPSRTYTTLPDKYDMVYKEIKLNTLDGKAEINVWDFPATVRYSSASVVLIAHNGEGNMADYLKRVDQFLKQGHRVIIFDYRGYGSSSKFEIDNNMYIYPQFINDLETAIQYVWQKTRQPFSLYGWGIGAGLAVGVGYNHAEVKRIIADTPFLSMEDLENRFSKWDEPMDVPFAGYNKRFEPIHALSLEPSKNFDKILFIIGSNDILFTSTDYKRIMQSQSDLNASLQVIENPDRTDNFKADKAAYMKAVGKFLGS
ncbi:MAG: alpha/beta fold hydrolase [Bacteroidota bacterium]